MHPKETPKIASTNAVASNNPNNWSAANKQRASSFDVMEQFRQAEIGKAHQETSESNKTKTKEAEDDKLIVLLKHPQERKKRY